jgi:hypothetical protein
MRPGNVIAVFVALCLVVQCTGCSLIFAKTTKNPDGWTQCSSGYSLPIIDTVTGLGIGVGAVSAFVLVDSTEHWNSDIMGSNILNIYGGLILSLTAIIYLVSAVYGYYHATKCSEVKEAAEKNRFPRYDNIWK